MAIKKLHTVKDGENVALIASDNQVSVNDIVNTNPDVFTLARISKSNAAIAGGDLVPGGLLIYPNEILKIPTGEIDTIAQNQAIKADNTDDLAIFIRGQKCPNPNTFKFIEYFDTCSDSFQIEFPYDAGNRLFDADPENFKLKGMPDIKIYIGEDPALSGEIEKVGHSLTQNSSTQTLGGRTKTRLLEKSETMPSVQVDFLDLKLDEIAQTFCTSHGLKVKVETGTSVGDKFEKVTRTDTEKPFTLISKLAQQRKLIVSNTPEGDCLLRKAISSAPVARFNVNPGFLDFLGVQQLDFEFDTTNIFGNYIGKTQTDDDDNATSNTPGNILLERSSKTFNFKDVTEAQLQGLVEREKDKATREFYKNTIPYPSWIIPGLGRRWRTGDIVTIIAPEAGIKTERILLIRQIDFSLDNNDKRIASLNLVPIEVYS